MTVNSVSAVETVSQIELTNQLLLKLEARDKIIADLQGRVKRLENRVDVGSPSKANQYNESKIQNQHTKTASAKSKSSVGSFEVDEIAAERALERTLVQTGALLLPFGQAEIQPFSTYTRRESSALELLQVNNNLLVGVNREARRNEIDAGLFVRVGLPFEAQAEFRLPGRIVNESQIRKQNTIGLNNVEVSDNTGYALGDISIGIAKTLTREDGWLPDLVGRFTWDTDSGDLIDNKVSMGTGFNDVIVSLTALKRQDPLAFTGTVSYQKTFKEFGIEPGDKFNLSVNASLAASPQTSLSIGLQQSFSKKTKINDVEIDGTDTTTSALIFGASSTIGRRMFFSLFAGIGLTESSPDYFVNIAIPLRFDIPFKSLSSLEF
ncbi:MAG: hypothetical protein KAI17_16075 [Thiotrichaceae bacterium]|nr:hypothetical protein [Thiotrichaceae bacterium]